MQTITCDVCLTNEADKRFKVMTKSSPFLSSNKWDELDICQDCYNKFIKLIPEEPKNPIVLAFERLGKSFEEAFRVPPAISRYDCKQAEGELPAPPDGR